jgi:hypothetical protein
MLWYEIRKLKTGDESRRRLAVDRLAEYAKKGSSEAFGKLSVVPFTDKSTAVRVAAVRSLQMLGVSPYVEIFRGFLEHGDIEVRAAALAALEQDGGPRADKVLTERRELARRTEEHRQRQEQEELLAKRIRELEPGIVINSVSKVTWALAGFVLRCEIDRIRKGPGQEQGALVGANCSEGVRTFPFRGQTHTEIIEKASNKINEIKAKADSWGLAREAIWDDRQGVVSIWTKTRDERPIQLGRAEPYRGFEPTRCVSDVVAVSLGSKDLNGSVDVIRLHHDGTVYSFSPPWIVVNGHIQDPAALEEALDAVQSGWDGLWYERWR